jgi:hypothetical protein
MNRRTLIKTGLFGGIGLGLIRTINGPFFSSEIAPKDSAYSYQFLTNDDRVIVAAIIPVMLKDALSKSKSDQQKEILAISRSLDRAVLTLPVLIQGEVKELFSLLSFSPTRRLLAGVWNSWSTAKEQEIHDFLMGWKRSSLELLQTAYQALHELIVASWYSNPVSWSRIGYPGPPRIK